MARRKRTKSYYAMSRRRKNALIAAFFFFLLPLAMVVDRQLLRPARETVRTAAWASADRKRYHQQSFAVAEVVDGDTVDIDAADGDQPTTRVRLIGVDTPETKHPTVGPMYFGQEATAFTRRAAEGRRVTILLDTVSAERDRYGRLLAYVLLPDGRVLNEELIRNGFGYADLRFEHGRFDDYVSLMDAGIAQKAGLWREVSRAQLPQWLRRERPELLR